MRKVSCICPTYNRHDWLEDCIKMFIKQTYKEKELIIIDDSPTPFKHMLLQNTQVKYFHYKKRFSSIGKKRNVCVEKSTGDIITHWDDDDYNHPKRIEKQVEKLKKDKLNMIVFDDTILLDVKKFKQTYGNKNIFKFINNHLKSGKKIEDGVLWRATDKRRHDMWYMGVILSGMMYDRKIWNKIKYDDISLAEDAWFLIDTMEIYENNLNFVTLKNNNLFIYTKHPSSTWTKEFKNIHTSKEWKSIKVLKF